MYNLKVLGIKDRFVDIKVADDLGALVSVFLLALRDVLFSSTKLLKVLTLIDR